MATQIPLLSSAQPLCSYLQSKAPLPPPQCVATAAAAVAKSTPCAVVLVHLTMIPSCRLVSSAPHAARGNHSIANTLHCELLAARSIQRPRGSHQHTAAASTGQRTPKHAPYSSTGFGSAAGVKTQARATPASTGVHTTAYIQNTFKCYVPLLCMRSRIVADGVAATVSSAATATTDMLQPVASSELYMSYSVAAGNLRMLLLRCARIEGRRNNTCCMVQLVCCCCMHGTSPRFLTACEKS